LFCATLKKKKTKQTPNIVQLEMNNQAERGRWGFLGRLKRRSLHLFFRQEGKDRWTVRLGSCGRARARSVCSARSWHPSTCN